MILLVLAQTPPPLHGQSAMVQVLVEGLPRHGIALHHVNFRLSRDSIDIGRWRPAKAWSTLRLAFRALAARFKRRCDVLYYVPAPPAKRGALYRDWVIMALCRPFFPRVVLHWHAAGLGEWLEREGTFMERTLSRALLGRADLAIVLAEALRSDAGLLHARRVAVVPNGVPDPGRVPPAPSGAPFHLLFLALGSEEKGLFAAARAVVDANRKANASAAKPAFTLTAAGPFADEATAARWRALEQAHPLCLRHVGAVNAAEKQALFAETHALCLPTHYSAEALPLVAIEALAHDRPVIATRWRGLPDIVTPEVGLLVTPGDERALVDAIIRLRDHPPAAGACRVRFEQNFALERHLSALADALMSIR